MDDIIVFAKNGDYDTNKKMIYSQDIGMEFAIEKYFMLIMKKMETRIALGKELANQESIRMLAEKDIYKYLGILEENSIK